MSDRLFDLLPAIYKVRDHEQGGSLRELLEVIDEQVAVLEEDLDQLYDDLFIETCAEWVVPYIGDLIGYRSLHHKVPALGSPRAEVANTIGHRRRKGTVAMLEQLARDVTGWPAKVVEFFQLLATTQFMNHVRLHNALTPDLRRWDALEALDGPFDTLAHTVDTRRIATGDGRYNIPNIGIFLWRLHAYPLTGSPAARVDAQRFMISPLGHDTPLFTNPETEQTVTHLAHHLNVPAPIGRRRMSEFKENYYGEDKSVFIEGFGADEVLVCDLSDHEGGWAHTLPETGRVAIDPVLGRIALGDPPEAPPVVTFHYGFSASMGGGAYERAATFAVPHGGEPGELPLLRVPDDHADISSAVDALGVEGGVVQLSDNSRYEGAFEIELEPGERFELRAADGRRPTVVLDGDLVISGGDEQAEVSLNGLLIVGGGLRVTGTLRRLRIRHCTLVPGLTRDIHGAAEHGDAPSLVVERGGVSVEVDHCILGGIRAHDLTRVEISDSILDATDDAGVAFAGLHEPPAEEPELPPPGGPLRLEECTVVGKIHARIMELVSNSILLSRRLEHDVWPASVLVQRRQTGCVRFSFLPADARTPKRYRCQPDLEIARRTEIAAKEAEGRGRGLTEAQRAAVRREVVASLMPAFTSLRYGHPGYGQLRFRQSPQILEGADDSGSMGAFHALFEPQRRTNLRIRLEEYLRFGLEAGFFATT